MKLTKYKHACFTVEKNSKVIVVDPGGFSDDFSAPNNVVGIIVTHEHSDHLNHSMIEQIFAINPSAILIADVTIVAKIPHHPNIAVSAGSTLDLEGFKLEFLGGIHADIHPDMPEMVNVGVLIDEKLYYPGDSLALPDRPIEVLALPVAAPWLKISEAMDFLVAVRPRLVFPTHDAILSEAGKNMTDQMLGATAKSIGATYQRLQEPLEL